MGTFYKHNEEPAMTSAIPPGGPRDCHLCRGLGWIVTGDPTRIPLDLELTACVVSGCPASGRAVAQLDQQAIALPEAPRHYIWQRREHALPTAS
jgi:hypothetical protein